MSLNLNKRLVESLILAGAFDSFNVNRRTLMAIYADYMDRVSAINKKKNEVQISLFGTLFDENEGLELEYPDMAEYSSKEKLALEKAVLGIYLSGHPLSDYRSQFEKYTFNTSVLDFYEEDEDGVKTYTEIKDGEHVIMGGIITDFKKLPTRSGQNMAFLKIEDLHGQIEAVCFPKVYEKCIDNLSVEQIVKIVGKIQIKEGVAQIIAEMVEKLEIKETQEVKQDQEYMGIIIPDERADDLNNILDILTSYPGDIPVIIALKGKKYSANCAVRRAEGLMSELGNYVGANDIIFFRKKQ